jgi:hypothetical protein
MLAAYPGGDIIVYYYENPAKDTPTRVTQGINEPKIHVAVEETDAHTRRK